MLDTIRFQLFLATFTGWVCQRQTRAISYLIEENRVLKEQLGGRRLRLTRLRATEFSGSSHVPQDIYVTTRNLGPQFLRVAGVLGFRIGRFKMRKDVAS